MKTLICTLFAFVMVWESGCAKPTAASQTAVIDPGRYYAVLLDNNSVYFGKLDSLTTDYAVLHDVFYVQSNVDQQTKAVSNVLIRRGKEWHGPDRMIVNQKAIVFIEPVGTDSRVAQLIAASAR
ncbi:MAG TPA: hypothetical protein VHW09_22290 [Bryobacteraceae bacterium]|jgi:hypothetical protein|nr:hypothetical protein [Bryobacteraceae bacterium]